MQRQTQAVAFYDQTVASYRETVLTSFQQVEDNLAALRILENEARTQNEAVLAAPEIARSLDPKISKAALPATWKSPWRRLLLSNEATAVNILGRRMVAGFPVGSGPRQNQQLRPSSKS